MKKIDFDTGEWDDFIEITLFGDTYKIRIGTWNDSIKIDKIQKELEKLQDSDIAKAERTLDFLVERFAEAGATCTRDQFMNLSPAKTIAILKAISQGAIDDSPLEEVVF